MAVSKQVSSVTLDEIVDEGTAIRERDSNDRLIIVSDSRSDLIGYGATITLCGVDPQLITALTGQPLVTNANGDVVGFDATSGVDLGGFGFALEVWSRISGQGCSPSGHRMWGYTPFPFLKGGRLGGFSFANEAVTFTISGAQTKPGNKWGVGPYDVDRGLSGLPSRLHTPLGPNTHYRNIMVSLDPPVASCGGVIIPDPGGGSGLILIDHGDGTFSVIGSPVADNLDGTFTGNDPAFTNNGDGSYGIVA